ncbi:MAG: sugar transferase [Acidimicrobiales bacterium]|jgi:exopolysaccharide biosynthesis polyprenyl glycosylphosphotransferase|nr:sugar transferase [Acidimicrobiales bacterium]
MRRGARLALYGGIVVAVVGLSLYHARVIADPPYSYTGTFRFGWSLLYIGVLLVTAYGLGLPELPRSAGRALVASILAAVSGAVVISVLQLLTGDALLPRFVVFGSAVLLVPWYLACAAMATGGRQRAADRDRVLVVATLEEVEALRRDLRRAAEHAASIVQVVLPGEAGQAPGKPAADGPLVAAAVGSGATVVVLDREAESNDSIVDQAAELHGRGMRVRSYALFVDEWLGKVPLFELERVSLLFDVGEVHRARYGRVKRLIDVAVGLVATLLFTVVVPFVALGDLVANRGPLLFRQERVGKNGRPFQILKFRTMRPDPGSGEGGAGTWTQQGDPRVTSFGRVLRATHLDELPQAVNILRGDLSVVGPRPEQPHYVDQLTSVLPFYELRHLVRPGLTGWAQVKYPYGADESDAREKLQYEFWYLRHQGLALDLRIIGRTVRSVLGGEGR